MFRGTNILKFVKTFDNKEKCLKYLSSLKWRKGFSCPKCGNTSWSKTKDFHIRRCNKCRHKDSATAGSLYHLDIEFTLKYLFIEMISANGFNDICMNLSDSD